MDHSAEWLQSDFARMRLCMELAGSARGQTWPNPMVGAVVVQNGGIVGMGAHLKAGTPHAEVHAIRMAGDQAEGSTVYVSLEPCSHFGRTPPCADLLVASGVKRVVIAMLDPNPLVAGQGVQKLRDAGIQVDIGLMEQEARALNEAFVVFITKKRPYTMVKTASTLDGKISTSSGDSKWISSEASREWVHQLRAEYPAIVVGKGTVLSDDPLLTCRLSEGGRNPIRIVLDSQLSLSLDFKIFQTREAATWIACVETVPDAKVERFANAGIEVLKLPPDSHGRVSLPALWELLGQKGIAACMVEGGGSLIGSLVSEKLVDQWIQFISPKLVGGNGPSVIEGLEVQLMRDALRFKQIQMKQIGDDFAIVGTFE